MEHFEKMEQRVKELEAELERLRAELAENSGKNWSKAPGLARYHKKEKHSHRLSVKGF